MKFLVLFGVFAAALALPLPDPDDCDTNVLLPGTLPYATHHLGYAPQAPVAYAAQAPVAYAAPAHLSYAAQAPVAYAAPAHLSYAAQAPVAYAAQAPVAYAAQAPVAYAAPAPVAYAAPAPVHLSHAEVQIPVTKTHVEVPVHQQVHYGTQSYVAGSSTTIHKPALAAPAISPPSSLLSKISYKAPEVTIKEQEIPVENHTPNFVETPYHAGTIVKYTAPDVKEIKVPTPVGVPHAVRVPYSVPVPTPVHSVSTYHAAVAPAVGVAPLVVKADDC